MAYSVWSAFDTFCRNYIDLPSDEVAIARSSRDFLLGQLSNLSTGISGFPTLTGQSLQFGSFARKTKIRPLDDIDFLIILNSQGTSETIPPSGSGYNRWLRMDDKTKPLANFLDAYGFVNSTRVLNKIRDSLPNVSQYAKAEIKKNQQAVVINLKSYSWVFDVVPAVAVQDVWKTGISHYLIPDGAGEWIRTDPRKDAANMTAANQNNGGNLLPVMRLLKYWNNHTYNKPRLPSYYFETLVLRTFQGTHSLASVQSGLDYFFNNAPLYLNMACPDPKRLGPNLDAAVGADARQKVNAALREAAQRSGYALLYERQSDAQNAIYEIFLRLLRQARRSAGINQREVAEKMNESTLFVSRCERGERRMDPIELLSYCEAIEQPATEFMRKLEDAVKGT